MHTPFSTPLAGHLCYPSPATEKSPENPLQNAPPVRSHQGEFWWADFLWACFQSLFLRSCQLVTGPQPSGSVVPRLVERGDCTIVDRWQSWDPQDNEVDNSSVRNDCNLLPSLISAHLHQHPSYSPDRNGERGRSAWRACAIACKVTLHQATDALVHCLRPPRVKSCMNLRSTIRPRLGWNQA